MTTARLEWRSEKGYGMAKDETGEMIFVPANLVQEYQAGDTVLIRKRKGSCGNIAEELLPVQQTLGNPNQKLLEYRL
jgi:hypothetical protein